MKEIIYLYDSKGNVTIFNDRKEAALKLGYGFINNLVGKYLGSGLNDMEHYRDGNVKYRSDFILRNEYGDILTFQNFSKIFDEIREEKNKNKNTRWNRYSLWNGTGPVPGTGNKRYGRYFRSPKTLKNLKYYTGVLEEFEPKVKIRGGRSSMPTSWDDISINFTRSWKSHRKTQYK
jgi:hypothetical protein